METVSAELGIWVDEARATEGFDELWNAAPRSTRTFTLACFALADLSARSRSPRYGH